MRQLLDPRHPILVGVEARLHHPQRERRHLQHLPAPADRLGFELRQRDDGVDQPHLQRLLSVVLATQKPDLLGFLGTDEPRQLGGAEAAVERSDLRADLAEAGVVGGDRQVADDVQDMAAADRPAGDHRDDRLRQAAHLHVQVRDVEPADRPLRPGLLWIGTGDVAAAVAADALIAT